MSGPCGTLSKALLWSRNSTKHPQLLSFRDFRQLLVTVKTAPDVDIPVVKPHCSSHILDGAIKYMAWRVETQSVYWSVFHSVPCVKLLRSRKTAQASPKDLSS